MTISWHGLTSADEAETVSWAWVACLINTTWFSSMKHLPPPPPHTAILSSLSLLYRQCFYWSKCLCFVSLQIWTGWSGPAYFQAHTWQSPRRLRCHESFPDPSRCFVLSSKTQRANCGSVDSRRSNFPQSKDSQVRWSASSTLPLGVRMTSPPDHQRHPPNNWPCTSGLSGRH